ncbi:hypothetical protein LRU_00229 [Ligilactobacillus ruminis SPM0211]|uniref:Uncharacterized protein n=1 Tax=Ligilactobacillus ruminis SPM0211 TaxID=1040964 RepID=F7QXT8_9LACO|nr:hypothetical protein LRU_00229 [Ligilactobacillus ruminis SPM0211]
MRFTAFSERNFQISDGLFCILHLQPAVFLLFLNEAGDVLCVVIAEFLALRSQCLLQSWRVGHVELPHGLTVVCDNHCPVSRQFTDEKLHLTVCSPQVMIKVFIGLSIVFSADERSEFFCDSQCLPHLFSCFEQPFQRHAVECPQKICQILL